MRILIAPDKFKGSLTSFDAAEAMRRGAVRACPGAEVIARPLSDGGEGIADVLVAASGGRTHSVRVTGPLGATVNARWAMLGDGTTAVVESAEAAGLTLAPESSRSPVRATTFGVGQLIRSALDAGATRVVVGLGGSATNDGGVGMAQALGVAFDGIPSPAAGGDLLGLRRIDVTHRDPRLKDVIVLHDVTNPLTGADGATRVYGPQKGATEDQVRELDAALTHLTNVVGDPGTCAGDGAAGGLGYGLRVFAGARLASGIDYVLDAVRFDEALLGCDLVLTGEGRLDASSARGKVAGGIARRCREHGVPVVALAGAVGDGAESVFAQGLTACFSLCDAPITATAAMERAASLLEKLAENVTRLASAWRERP